MLLEYLHFFIIHRLVGGSKQLGPQLPGLLGCQREKIVSFIFVGFLKKIEVPFAGMMDNHYDLVFLGGLKGELFADTGQISHFYYHGITSLLQ